MKKSQAVAAVFLCLLVILLTLILKRKSIRSDSTEDGPKAIAVDEEEAIRSPGNSGIAGGSPFEKGITENATIQKMLSGGNVPIEFFGRVLDQNGGGLEGVEIEVEIQKAADVSPVHVGENRIRDKVRSTQNGDFRISGHSGAGLSIIKLSKEGFSQPTPDYPSFTFGPLTPRPFKADSADPQIYYMLKSGSAKPHKAPERKLKFKWNGEPESIPIGSGGSEVLFQGARDRKDGAVEKFNWKVSISGQGVLLQEVNANNVVMAPLSGYESRLTFKVAATEVPWAGSTERRICFKTADGKYGSFLVYIRALSDEGMTSGTVVVSFNDSGGRVIK